MTVHLEGIQGVADLDPTCRLPNVPSPTVEKQYLSCVAYVSSVLSNMADSIKQMSGEDAMILLMATKSGAETSLAQSLQGSLASLYLWVVGATVVLCLHSVI